MVETMGNAVELKNLLAATTPLLEAFVASAEDSQISSERGQSPNGSLCPNQSPNSSSPGQFLGNDFEGSAGRLAPISYKSPEEIGKALHLELPTTGQGLGGLVSILERILSCSINTWHQGFMHKLCASTNAVGVISELILAVLNTNLHVFEVSPALTVIEKTTARAFATRFGLVGEYSGGITQSGGSGANLTALVIARGYLFPKTRSDGNEGVKLAIFTSQASHYSVEKAARVCGLGSRNVWQIPTDAEGRMCADKLEHAIKTAWGQGYEPFFANATAGTTVMGAYDPLEEIADICQAYGLWFHVDASWGGSVVFSDKYRFRLNGAERANSLTVNPHKMLGVPVTCSFLLTSDLRKFHRANSLPAGYLFHDVVEASPEAATGDFKPVPESRESEVWDLADLTLQCGRKGDALKLALGWVYYGSAGYGQKIEDALDIANHLSTLICAEPDLVPVGPHPVPCLQVCFYFAPGGILLTVERNTAMTKAIAARLVGCGFMADYAPGEHGSFLRVVVNISTKRQTVERMVREILRLGRECSEASATPGILRTQRADSIPEASTRPTEPKSCTEQHGPSEAIVPKHLGL